jgi:hypothetical protein
MDWRRNGLVVCSWVVTYEEPTTPHSVYVRFISFHNIDVMLISETHFTEKSYLKLLNYTVYHTNYPITITAKIHPASLRSLHFKAQRKKDKIKTCWNRLIQNSETASWTLKLTGVRVDCTSNKVKPSHSNTIGMVYTFSKLVLYDYTCLIDPGIHLLHKTRLLQS